MKDKIVILVLLVVVVGMCVALGISLNKKCPTLPHAPVPDTYVDGSDETINSLFNVLTDENASITDMDHSFIDTELFTNNKVTVNDLSDVDLFNIIVDKIIRENGNNYQVNISGDKILQEIIYRKKNPYKNELCQISFYIIIMSENIITVSCPECENHFSFSRNVLDFDGGKGIIQFSCIGCGNTVKICYTDQEKEILVQILE